MMGCVLSAHDGPIIPTDLWMAYDAEKHKRECEEWQRKRNWADTQKDDAAEERLP